MGTLKPAARILPGAHVPQCAQMPLNGAYLLCPAGATVPLLNGVRALLVVTCDHML